MKNKFENKRIENISLSKMNYINKEMLNMKKLIYISLSLVLAVGLLTGCGSKASVATNKNTPKENTSTASTTSTGVDTSGVAQTDTSGKALTQKDKEVLSNGEEIDKVINAFVGYVFNYNKDNIDAQIQKSNQYVAKDIVVISNNSIQKIKDTSEVSKFVSIENEESTFVDTLIVKDKKFSNCAEVTFTVKSICNNKEEVDKMKIGLTYNINTKSWEVIAFGANK